MSCHCGKPFVKHLGTYSTLVGYSSPPGHSHDDNCLKRLYVCEDSHRTLLSLRRRCPTSGCDWAGKARCFCHDGDKVEAWPDAPQASREEVLRG